jgi:DNA-binding CsgD family transcriptional regulator
MNPSYRTHPGVRPFILASGRTRTRTRHPLLVHTIVSAPRYDARLAASLTPHERTVYAHAQEGMSVAEVSAHTGLSLGLVRVLLGDLANKGAITIHPATESLVADRTTTAALLERVLHGLQQL